MDQIDRSIIETGKVIGNYEIVFLVGRGGFGDVYKVKDKKTSQMFALKTEELSAPIKSLQIEIDCLQHISGSCFPRVRATGTDKKFKISYLVMNLLGASVGKIRLKNDEKLPYETAFPVAHEMLRIIQKIHDFGYVHRDIKPSNFLTQQHPEDHLVLIDFGLCKKHIDENTNEPFPFSDDVQFTGTKKYASPNAHRHYELGRVDDLYSWFYGFLEIANGNLTWNEIKDTKELLRLKTETPVNELIGGLPSQVGEIYEYLNSLKYADAPDYPKLFQLMEDAERENNIDIDNFDWPSFYSQNANLVDLSKSPSFTRSSKGGQSSPKKKNAEEKNKNKDEDEEGNCCSIQ